MSAVMGSSSLLNLACAVVNQDWISTEALSLRGGEPVPVRSQSMVVSYFLAMAMRLSLRRFSVLPLYHLRTAS